MQQLIKYYPEQRDRVRNYLNQSSKFLVGVDNRAINNGYGYNTYVINKGYGRNPPKCNIKPVRIVTLSSKQLHNRKRHQRGGSIKQFRPEPESKNLQSVVIHQQGSFRNLPYSTKWIKKHGYKPMKVDVTSQSYRYRIQSPKHFRGFYYVQDPKVKSIKYDMGYY